MGFLAANKGCSNESSDQILNNATNGKSSQHQQKTRQETMSIGSSSGSNIYNPEEQPVTKSPSPPVDDGVWVQVQQKKTPPATDWILLLNKFTDPDRAEHFKNAYQSRDIEIYTMTNGEYWAVIDLETETDCQAEKKDWKRHRKDSDGLILKVMQVSFKK
jgi:hypothetical protein